MDPLLVVALGDSTTAGSPGFQSPLEAPPEGRGNPESQYAHWMAKAHPEWRILNRGIDGQRSDEVLARFPRDVLAVHPRYVIVLAGVNDIYQGKPRFLVERNLRSMYTRALEAGIRPVAATILPYDEATPEAWTAIEALNGWIRSTAGRLAIPFCDTNAAVADPRNPRRLASSPDGLHPDVDGYRRLGEALAGVILQDIEGNPGTTAAR